jgi:hypothetical protein
MNDAYSQSVQNLLRDWAISSTGYGFVHVFFSCQATTMASVEDFDVTQQSLFSGLDLVGANAVHAAMSSPWDPFYSADWDCTKPSEQCYLRIKRLVL